MKVSKEQLEMLKNIMALDFTCIELNLYLDTHPMDEQALAAYNRSVVKSMELKELYQREHNMITPAFTSDDPWNWISEPWPWEIDYEMEGTC